MKWRAFALLLVGPVAALTQTSGTAEAQAVFAPIPDSARGPAVPRDKRYLVEEIRDDLYWVTDGLFQTMFLTTGEGVIVIDAPASIGPNMLIADVTDEPITHVIYSHAHADHISAAGLYPASVTIIAQEETAAKLARADADNPDRPIAFGSLIRGGPVPLPTTTFADTFTLNVGSQTLELAYRGPNHMPGNIFIYAPRQRTLMLVDIVMPGWAPLDRFAIAEDVRGYIQANRDALEFEFDTFVGGHLTRLGMREDVELNLQYTLNVRENAEAAARSIDLREIAAVTGFDNPWALLDRFFDETAQRCNDATVPDWLGRLGGVDVVTFDNCMAMGTSLRLE